MKLESIYLENVKGFQNEKFDFNLNFNESSLTVILGENGTGKSTILKSIVNNLTAFNPKYNGDFFDKEDIYNNNKVMRIKCSYVLSKPEVEQIYGDEYLFSPELKNFNIHITLPGMNEGEKVNFWVDNDDEKTHFLNIAEKLSSMDFVGANVFYFDPFRFLPIETIDGPNTMQLPENSRHNTLTSTVSKKRDLNNRFLQIKQWLINMDFARLKSPTDENIYIFEKVTKSFDVLFNPFKFKGISDRGEIFFSDGERLVEIDRLSEGFKSVFILIGEILFRLNMAYPNKKDFFTEESIILIDEIDCHLHPKWQVKILPYLTELFSNSQFIVTTHSPFITTGINKNSILKLGEI